MDRERSFGIKKNVLIIVGLGAVLFLAGGAVLGLWSAGEMREEVGRQFNEQQLAIARHVSALIERQMDFIKRVREKKIRELREKAERAEPEWAERNGLRSKIRRFLRKLGL